MRNGDETGGWHRVGLGKRRRLSRAMARRAETTPRCTAARARRRGTVRPRTRKKIAQKKDRRPASSLGITSSKHSTYKILLRVLGKADRFTVSDDCLHVVIKFYTSVQVSFPTAGAEYRGPIKSFFDRRSTWNKGVTEPQCPAHSCTHLAREQENGYHGYAGHGRDGRRAPCLPSREGVRPRRSRRGLQARRSPPRGGARECVRAVRRADRRPPARPGASARIA